MKLQKKLSRHIRIGAQQFEQFWLFRAATDSEERFGQYVVDVYAQTESFFKNSDKIPSTSNRLVQLINVYSAQNHTTSDVLFKCVAHVITAKIELSFKMLKANKTIVIRRYSLDKNGYRRKCHNNK